MALHKPAHRKKRGELEGGQLESWTKGKKGRSVAFTEGLVLFKKASFRLGVGLERGVSRGKGVVVEGCRKRNK